MNFHLIQDTGPTRHLDRLFDDVVHIYVAQRLGGILVGIDVQVFDDRGNPAAHLDDVVQILLDDLRAGFFLQALRKARDAVQRVVNFMGDAGRQGADGR